VVSISGDWQNRVDILKVRQFFAGEFVFGGKDFPFSLRNGLKVPIKAHFCLMA
jgi:hypothetical protein